ncbi:bifunctional metallophosphatase/5'-nucleotidase [Amnibacterium flavum]|uniref:bifunctional metallophosphatase/5'-nucleotidase n=1 Tax=Amnibacterium flavum TaxID=2173173 RepID=UPI001F0C3C71|nr:bifunctional UDP-sugar hydrolase/5'-nucleotidase [Amnibacterium flavum]
MPSNTPPFVRRRTEASRIRGRVLAVVTTGALATGMALAGAGAAHAADVTIDIVTINDFHGRLEGSTSSAVAGAAVLGGAVDSVRAENPNTLMVSAGDNIGASTFTSFIQDDEPTIEALNLMGLDASAAGNHEFDQGYEDLLTRVVPQADFPILSANVDGPAAIGELPEYSIEEVAGVRIGFIGAVTEDLPSLVSPAGMQGVVVGGIVDNVNRVADYLSDGDDSNGEADVIVTVVHEGAETSGPTTAITQDSVFGRIVSGLDGDIDAIVSGHTHQRYAGTVAFDPYQRPVIQAGQYSEAMGRLTLTIDPATGVISSFVPVVVPLSTQTSTDPVVWAPNYPADPDIAALVADATAVADVLGSAPLGYIASDFSRAQQSGGTENRGGESTLGNFVADVQLWSTAELGTEVAIMNPGGLRADLVYEQRDGITGDATGLVTYREAAEVQPFANTLVTLTLTGDQIKQVLEQQWQPAGSSRPFLKLGLSSALTYTYDPAAAAGSHITGISLNGAPLDPGTPVKVVANSFLAAGGDNFTAFTLGTDSADSGRVDLQGMVDYFAAQGSTPQAPDTAQRSVGVQLAASADGGYLPGDSAQLNLSSLLFSKGEATPPTAEARINGQLVGSGPIDPTIVDTLDEVGRAAFPITIPNGLAAGVYDLVITTPGTATTATVPITVTAVTATSGRLPATGLDASIMIAPAIVAALLIAIGIALVLLRRSRRHTPVRARVRSRVE